MKQNQRRAFTPEELGWIAHALPHRVRIQAPLLASRPEVCRRMAETLTQSLPIERVTVNIITGSFIVEARPGNIEMEALLARFRECVAAEVQQFPSTISGPTKVARSVARAFSALNADMRGGLGHRADLTVLLPVFLGTAAVAQLVTAGRVPGPAWFNFTWWAFRSFLTFHKDAGGEDDLAHEPAQNVDAPRNP